MVTTISEKLVSSEDPAEFIDEGIFGDLGRSRRLSEEFYRPTVFSLGTKVSENE